jgi:predicted protein tyrosine phosphatase
MIKKITFLSQRDAELIEPVDNDHIISIWDDYEPKLSENWSSILPVIFSDIDSDEEGLQIFTEDMAKQIKKYAKDIHSSNEECHLYIHCFMGVSRSCAVAKYLSEEYSLKFDKRRKSFNQHVYKTLAFTI